MTTLLFAHGLESGPIGRKSQALIDADYEVIAPDCRGQDLATRIDTLVETIERASSPPVLVGSSFGGIAGLVAAMVAASRGHSVPALLLCAPALQLPPPPGTVEQLGRPAPTNIVHGTRDEVNPNERSRSYVREHGGDLREVDDEHGLGGPGLAVILAAVRQLAGAP
ncbi:MAG: alpha/beta fold hydrolase [Nannocystaceae bacterium]